MKAPPGFGFLLNSIGDIGLFPTSSAAHDCLCLKLLPVPHDAMVVTETIESAGRPSMSDTFVTPS
jgi:hypothetical protein